MKEISKTKIKVKDEVKMKLNDNERTWHCKTWRTHCKSRDSLKKSRGKVYSLLLGQCTLVLVDKMKQDSNWVMISTLLDPNLLFQRK
jgi:hypothetical protein